VIAPMERMASVEDRIAELDRKYFESRKDRIEVESSYASGEATRMNPAPRGIDPLGSDADYHYRSEHNYFLHVERGRAAVRNHPLVEQGINRLVTNLRLDGFVLDVDSGDEELDNDIKADWLAWCGETAAGQSLCDYEGTRTFQQIARQSFFNRVTDGDIVHLPLLDGRMQTWESHHVRTPFGAKYQNNSDQDGFVHGVEIRNGRTVAYWITPHNVPYYGSLTRLKQAKRFPVFDSEGNKITFWLGFRHRFFQRRGISRLSAPRDAMTGFEDLNYANTKSSLRRALIAYLMEDSATSSPTWQPGQSSPIPRAGQRSEQQVGNPLLGVETAIVEQAGEPAQIIKAPDGKTLKGWNASIPTQSFFDHASLMLNMLSVNLDLPLSILLLDGSKSNFHGQRFIWDQCKLRFRQIQHDEIQGLWAPTYEHRMRQKLNPDSPLYDPNWARAVDRGANPFSYVFRSRGWPYVKPLEDAMGEDLAEKRNLQSQREILAGRGIDLDQHIPQVINDRASWVRYSISVAKNIAAKHTDLPIDVLGLSRELRYGDQSTEKETVPMIEEPETPEPQPANAQEADE